MRCCAWSSSTAAARRRVKGYSLGMRQRLGLAAALLGDPELLILDEPANGLDPEGVRWLRDFLRAFAAGERTVLVSSHVLAEVAQTVDQVLIINRGKLVVESSLEQLTARVGGSVRVRTPEPSEAAARRCSSEQIETTIEQRAGAARARDDAASRSAISRSPPASRSTSSSPTAPRSKTSSSSSPRSRSRDRADQRRAAEDPLDPHDDRDRARDDRPDPPLLAALRTAHQSAEPDEHRGPARPARASAASPASSPRSPGSCS